MSKEKRGKNADNVIDSPDGSWLPCSADSGSDYPKKDRAVLLKRKTASVMKRFN